MTAGIDDRIDATLSLRSALNDLVRAIAHDTTAKHVRPDDAAWHRAESVARAQAASLRLSLFLAVHRHEEAEVKP